MRLKRGAHSSVSTNMYSRQLAVDRKIKQVHVILGKRSWPRIQTLTYQIIAKPDMPLAITRYNGNRRERGRGRERRKGRTGKERWKGKRGKERRK